MLLYFLLQVYIFCLPLATVYAIFLIHSTLHLILNLSPAPLNVSVAMDRTAS